MEDEASALANVTIAAASVSTSPGFLDINLRSFGLTVSQGDVLAIVLRSAATEAANSYLWREKTELFGADGYTGGAACIHGSGWACYASSGFQRDYGFQSFVMTPEPGTALLLAAGLTALAARRAKSTS